MRHGPSDLRPSDRRPLSVFAERNCRGTNAGLRIDRDEPDADGRSGSADTNAAESRAALDPFSASCSAVAAFDFTGDVDLERRAVHSLATIDVFARFG